MAATASTPDTRDALNTLAIRYAMLAAEREVSQQHGGAEEGRAAELPHGSPAYLGWPAAQVSDATYRPAPAFKTTAWPRLVNCNVELQVTG